MRGERRRLGCAGEDRARFGFCAKAPSRVTRARGDVATAQEPAEAPRGVGSGRSALPVPGPESQGVPAGEPGPRLWALTPAGGRPEDGLVRRQRRPERGAVTRGLLFAPRKGSSGGHSPGRQSSGPEPRGRRCGSPCGGAGREKRAPAPVRESRVPWGLLRSRRAGFSGPRA
uniref:Uncharacterized protein n=1 Tax=Myotis myotis TaxID=51298 RepID=A0A7J7UCM4_MYOMY|nr:hypothetical protein mMyoMyo1_008707 [Myotis myotis]